MPRSQGTKVFSLRWPSDLVLRDWVVASAERNRRSVNSEILFLLEAAIAGREVNKAAALETVS